MLDAKLMFQYMLTSKLRPTWDMDMWIRGAFISIHGHPAEIADLRTSTIGYQIQKLEEFNRDQTTIKFSCVVTQEHPRLHKYPS